MAFKSFKPTKTRTREDGGVIITCMIVDDEHGSYHTELALDSEELRKLPSVAADRKQNIDAKLKAHISKAHSEWVARQSVVINDEEQSIKAALDDVYTTLD